MNQTQGQNTQAIQNEELIFFDSKGLDMLIKQMGFEEVVQFDEKPKQMIIDIGNEFMNKLLEESMRVSQKRQQQNDELKNTKPKLAFQDVKFALENCLRMPQQNFNIEKDN
ncbi:unnamed protein product [Paramecium pentaurelia]|uniref:Uncharacterized protein n=1 Tax=Paramecium pentaurelia TaxID=43138 RepID=A0A8S1XGN1_9CILI|nr:unnamed protein product [Paramecium pentaurelia]